MKVTKLLQLFILLLASLPLSAQNVMTSSPYSMFGVGEIITGLYSSNAAMGGLSVGMRGSMLVNTDNPAALTALDTCRIFAEASLFAKWENYHAKGASNNAFTGNLSRFTLAGRIIPHWYAAIGVTPYSAVGYYFQSSQELEGVPGAYYTSTYSGNGGLSKLFLSNAFSLTKHLSVGANISYIFGNITQEEDQSTMSVSQKLTGRAFMADFGIQYYRPVNRDLKLTLGAVYGLSKEIRMENTKTIIDNSYSTEITQKKVRQELPSYFGLGGSVNYKKMTYGLDYVFHGYKSINSSDSRFTFHDSHEFRAGLNYSPNGYGASSIWKKMDYKMGIGVTTPYYMYVRSQSGHSWRVHAGLGFPLSNGKLNVGVFYDRVNVSNNMLERSLTGLTLTYTLSELFYRIKLD